MKTKPSTEYVLLGALMSGQKHGYEIMQFLKSSLEATWHVGTSQLYALLKRLEKEALLKSNIEQQDLRPSKRVFELTEKGRETFLKWLHSPTGHVRDFRIEFIAKLFFFYSLSIKGCPDLIDHQVSLFERVLKKIKTKKTAAEDPFADLVYTFKTENLKNLLKWLSDYAVPFFENTAR